MPQFLHLHRLTRNKRSLLARSCQLALVFAAAELPWFAQGQTSAAEPAQTVAAPTRQVEQSAAPASVGQSANSTELPGAIYKDAMQPLDVVRSSLDNWSDAELGALNVGMSKARAACMQTRPESYTGDDLFDLARLCSFGQDWNDANTAAQAYMSSGHEAHRAQAYTLSMSALLHLNAVDLATATAREMLRKLPYDAEVSYALRSMKDYLEQTGNPAALTLATLEHAAIVQALGQGVPLKAAHRDIGIGAGTLYESAMELAFFERYAGDDTAAASAFADVQGALQQAGAIPAEERQRTDAIELQYRLLGSRLPKIEVQKSLMSAKARPLINPDFGAATVLVLFPEWCTQCRRMMKTLTQFAAVNGDVPIHTYGLMFSDESDATDPVVREAELKELQGTATLVVPATTAQAFGAIDFPLGIVVDHAGLVRFIGAITGDAFNGDGYISKVVTRMAGKRQEFPATK